jgi:hypothetical protein
LVFCAVGVGRTLETLLARLRVAGFLAFPCPVASYPPSRVCKHAGEFRWSESVSGQWELPRGAVKN